MPIRPRHTPSEGRPVAQRQFTDREDFVKTFQAALTAKQPDKHHVLVFYGVGGIGKTSLRKELAKLIAEQDSVTSAVLDFETPSYRDMETALFALRKTLLNDFKVHFPTFDIAYAVCWQKSRPQTAMTDENLPFLQDSMVLSDLLAAVGVVPIIGVIPRLPYLFAKGRKVLQDWWTRRGSKELKELPSLEPPQIAERLPMFWASDLRDFLAAKGSKAVLFLDTYDALSESERVEGKLREREAWVRELVAQLPEVLWVICGREQLCWAEADQEWAGALQQHLVGGLAEADARRFLTACGIDDQAIQNAIVTGSQGVPYFLDLAVDTWVEIKERHNRIPKPDDFAHTRLEMFDRFLRHLTHPEVETLKVLSVPRFWDYPLCEALVTKFQTGFPLTAFDGLCRFSFISENKPAGSWRMHELMRQSLQEHQDPKLNQRVHRFLFEFYESRLADLRVSAITPAHREAFIELFFHGSVVLGPNELFDRLTRAGDVFVRAGDLAFIIPHVQQYARLNEVQLGAEDAVMARILDVLGNLSRSVSRLDESLDYFRRALVIAERAYGPDHIETARSLNGMAHTLVSQGHYAQAEPLFKRVLAIRDKACGSEHAETIPTLHGLGHVYWQLGRYAESEELNRRILAYCERTGAGGSGQAALALNMLGILHNEQGRCAEAVAMFRRALAINEKLDGPDQLSSTSMMNNLAEVWVRQGDFAEAEALYRRAYAVKERVFGPDSESGAYILSNLSRLCARQGRFAEGEELAHRALGIRKEVLGPEHPDVAISLCDLAELHHRQGRHADARRLLEQALAIRESALGSAHPLVAETLGEQAFIELRLGNLSRAEELARQALAIRERVFPADSLPVAESLARLAEVCVEQTRYSEAESLYQRALTVREKALGREHREVAEVIAGLGRLYELTGRHADAQALGYRLPTVKDEGEN